MGRPGLVLVVGVLPLVLRLFHRRQHLELPPDLLRLTLPPC